MDLNSIWTTVSVWLMKHGLVILIVVIIMLLILRYSEKLTSRFIQSVQRRQRIQDEEFEKRTNTLSGILHYVINIVVLIIAAIMILGEIGVDIGPILAAAGVLGLAIGFGAQSLVKDILSGFFIFLEDQIRVGDVVDIAGKAGIVEKINLKLTILRDLSGNVHFVPNGEINVVTNMTKGFSRYLFKVGVAYREDVDEVMGVMKQVDEELRNDDNFKDDIIAPLEMLGLDEFGDSALVIKAYTSTKPLKQWRIGREFNRRLKKAFDERNIEIPFPHVTLYMGEEKDHTAPPMHVNINEMPQKDAESSESQ